MTDTEINVAMAEVCGFAAIQQNPLYPTDQSRLAGFYAAELGAAKAGHSCAMVGIPNYAHDLNACHEAEKVLTEAQRSFYRRELCAAVGGTRTNLKTFEQITATARQRCEALLRTLGKWRDT